MRKCCRFGQVRPSLSSVGKRLVFVGKGRTHVSCPSASMASPRLDNYLRTYRKRSGLTQSEVAFLLGCKTSAQVSRYEKQHHLPPLRTALACGTIFRVHLPELFAGIQESVDQEIAERIVKLS